jgi:leader peptidase (prepilin peptidase)/N-methyltransferase
MFPDLTSYWWYLPVILLGACVGSFLNVVIYRMPLNLSVNDPKRSFCPLCKNPIPWWRNIPLLSWLLLRGKCADCHAKIPIRYWFVELLTALLFAACWRHFGHELALTLFILMAIFVAITFIDAEHQIIPAPLTYIGTAVGLISSCFRPELLHLISPNEEPSAWWQGLLDSAIGWTLGFFGLWSVVLLGKMMFGKKKISLDQPTDWQLIDATTDDEPLHFSLGDEKIPWWEIFYRKSDEMLLECDEIFLDEKACGSGQLKLRELDFTLPNGEIHQLTEIKSLSGKATKAIIPREAMGMGDPHLLGMIGAFIGGGGVLFTVCFSSFYALAIALLARIGLGKPLPFGPFLILAAATWIFGGWKLWEWYIQYLQFP